MIIQNPDGSYEICPLDTATVRQLYALLGRVRKLTARRSAEQQNCSPTCGSPRPACGEGDC
jgi:hypothetical protein